MAVNMFLLAEDIHRKLPSLRFVSGRWAIYLSSTDDSACTLYPSFIELMKWLPNEEGLFRLRKVITDGPTARRLEEILRGYCDDGEFHPWGLASIPSEAKRRFDEGERMNEPPEVFRGLKRQDFIILDRLTFHSYENGKFFIVSGKAGSGKSSLINVEKQILGNDSATIENSRGTGYDYDAFISKRLAYADDVIGDLPVDEGTLKSLVTHGDVTVDPKMKTKFTIRYPQCSLVFLSNEKPKINLGDSGILRRVCWYKKTVRIDNPDFKRLTRSYSEKELTDLCLFLLSFEEWLKNDAESHDWFDYFREDTVEMASASSTVYRFYSKIADSERSFKFNYANYRDWCKENGYRAYNSGNFEDQTDTLIDWGKINRYDLGQIS